MDDDAPWPCLLCPYRDACPDVPRGDRPPAFCAARPAPPPLTARRFRLLRAVVGPDGRHACAVVVSAGDAAAAGRRRARPWPAPPAPRRDGAP